ncbi:Uncharacterised protein [Mycolicibacterium vanbaalenii]|uniref:Uncharacterized protein n=1 Tax=Mycolicibacterium vanbaalenii TaxID=110539 RepID=A0A5S9R8V8_MYCVN|nr:hypothetical protein [Mycolicibacterium vanbaalenii]CAA0136350.1 Uncharacterised protein [Mycolicibacterium vanbaalenii]
MSADDPGRAVPEVGAASPRPGRTYAVQFTELALQQGGKTLWTLHQCGKCAALVVEDGKQAHANWHAQARSEIMMASMGFGGLGL